MTGSKPTKTDEQIPDDVDLNARGRDAETPEEIPKAGWWDIALRVKNELTRDNASFIASGVAFYLLIALVPTIGATVALYGLVADPGDVQSLITELGTVVPADALQLIEEQLVRITSAETTAGFAAIFGALVALWGASKAIDAMMTSLNIAYDEKETRGFIKRKATGLALTLGLAIFMVIVISLLVGAPVMLEFVGLGKISEVIINILRWPLLFAVAVAAMSMLYRWGPSRATPKWRWLSWGSIIATGVWMIASAGFSIYATNFGSYTETYGTLGAVVLLLFWFYLTGFSIILGAEINAEMEHQTIVDTTTGSPEPMGERGAHVADELGKSAAKTSEEDPKSDPPIASA